MKNRIAEAYTSFTRAERMGIAALGVLVLLLLAVRIALPYFADKPPDTEENARLAREWDAFKRQQVTPEQDSAKARLEKKDYQDAGDNNPSPMPDMININTADSATLVRLKGVGPKKVTAIFACRKNMHGIKVKSLIQSQCNVSKENYKLIAPHISVADKQ